MTLRSFNADFHIHTCLSPCAELEMSPLKIVRRARQAGLDVIAICDHNSVENVEAVLRAGRKEDLAVYPGIEISTREEVHVLGLFEKVEEALEVQQVVYLNLEGLNKEEYFGMQVIASESDDVIDFNPLFLAGTTSLSFERTVKLVHLNNGLAVASHIDRQAFGLISHFGFIPDDLELDAFEVTSRSKLEEISKVLTPRNIKPLVFNSDAHRLEEIGKEQNRIMAETREFENISKAITGGLS